MTPPRLSGVLLHPTSLPGPHGAGDFGAAAYHFVDWLGTAGQGLWQILPLGPTGPGNSPYMGASAFAIDPMLVDLDDLVARGWLDAQALAEARADPALEGARVDFAATGRLRLAMLRQAAQRFFDGIRAASQTDGPSTGERSDADFQAFCDAHRDWLDDYALFMAIDQRRAGERWQQWSPPLARRQGVALERARRLYASEIAFWQFVQWRAFRQWESLKRHANARGVRIVGDMPIFVAPHSADVWAHAPLFDLTDALEPRVVAGVPPDYFSPTGQRWGNPLYRWSAHAADGYAWWIARLRHLARLTDIVRIDHFRGFAAHWEVPVDAPDAIGGHWVPGPGAALFDALRSAFDGEALPVIAEDLGTITDDVIALRRAYELPGMGVLHFAFSDDGRNPYLPHNAAPDFALYTGTHDNDTSRGWFESATEAERRYAQVYLKSDGREIHWDLIHAASQSSAGYAIYPMQDVLGLGSEARMNLPGSPEGNWGWRFDWGQVQDWQARRLREISAAHGRNDLPWPLA